MRWYSGLVMSGSATPWTLACQASLSMGLSRQEYWSGLPFLTPRGTSQHRDWTWVSCIAGSLLHCRQVLYQLSHMGSPFILLSYLSVLPTNIFWYWSERDTDIVYSGCSTWICKPINKCGGTSPVVQWLRICLPVQGKRVQTLVLKHSTCHEAAGPVRCNCWAHAHLELALWDSRSQRNRKSTHCDQRKPACSSEDSAQPEWINGWVNK